MYPGAVKGSGQVLPLPSLVTTHPSPPARTNSLSLLQEVQRLATTLGVEGDVSYTCETAEYFRLYQVSR